MHLHLLHSYGLEGSKAMDTDCCVELLVARSTYVMQPNRGYTHPWMTRLNPRDQTIIHGSGTPMMELRIHR